MSGKLHVVTNPMSEGAGVVNDEMGDRREGPPDRRAPEQSSDFLKPKIQFLITVVLFAVTLGSIFWNRAGKERETDIIVAQSVKAQTEVIDRLKGIDGKLDAMALSNVGRDKDIEFLKTTVADMKREAAGTAGMLEARIIVLEKSIAKIEAKE